jgi:hypothetical protein
MGSASWSVELEKDETGWIYAVYWDDIIIVNQIGIRAALTRFFYVGIQMAGCKIGPV